MSETAVIFQRDSEEIATCILNRPKKRNALSIAMMEQLCARVKAMESDHKTRILVLRGNGPVFSAGLDLGESTDRRRWAKAASMVKEVLSTLYQTPLVTIAAVQGAALGGGAGLVAACDFAVADRAAKIGFPEAHRGIVAAQVMSLLVRKIRRADIRYLLLSGESVDAARALEMGLFCRIGDIETETRKIIAYVLRGAPGALAMTKQLLDRLDSRSLNEDIQLCRRIHLQVRNGEEAEEGINAFLEKRRPEWER